MMFIKKERMFFKKYFILFSFLLLSVHAYTKDYKASLFNIYADGTTLNTRSIQYAIDYIHDHGGGRLVFDVGKYLTGSIKLKSHVTLHLKEGAVLLGSLNPLDYQKEDWTALVFAINQQNVAITGKGIIDGRGQYVARNVVDLAGKGLLEDSLINGRPLATQRPVLIYFHQCRNIQIRGITLMNSSSWVEVYDHCEHLAIDNIHVDSKDYWNNDGIDIVDCQHVSVTNSYIDADDDGICLKSFDNSSICKDILIKNCISRSSANGIKFGTASHGGFSDIRIISNKVYNTYRSAVALEAVDGGVLDNVTVDSLEVRHTGNLFFLRIGERVKGKIGRLEHIHFSNIHAEIAGSKPDAGYPYEGPVEDMPRNISPAIILAGLPGHLISDVTFKNITIIHPGGGDSLYARVPLDSLDGIPELPAKYPEFSMFKELPAWAVFIRHAGNISFSDIIMQCEKKDFRVPVVLNDVHHATFHAVKIEQLRKAMPYYKYHSDNIIIE
jgi:hypothetical protein